MPGRIGIALRIVEDVAVAVQVLRVVGFLDVGIGRNEAADFLVVVSPAVVVKPALGIEFLAGEAVGGIAACRRSRCGTLGSGLAAPRIVFVELALGPAFCRDDVSPAEMVVVVEELCRRSAGGSLFGCERFNPDPDELGDRPVRCNFIALEREQRHAGRGVLLHSHAGVVVLHGCDPAAKDRDAGHPVVDVPGKGLGSSRRHVAVGVVGVVSPRGRVEGDGGRVHRVAVGERGTALVGEIANGVVGVSATALALVGAKGAGGSAEPAHIVVVKDAAGGKDTIGDGGEVARRIVTVGQVLPVIQSRAVNELGIVTIVTLEENLSCLSSLTRKLSKAWHGLRVWNGLRVDTIGEEKDILLHGNICAYLTCRLMGEPFSFSQGPVSLFLFRTFDTRFDWVSMKKQGLFPEQSRAKI